MLGTLDQSFWWHPPCHTLRPFTIISHGLHVPLLPLMFPDATMFSNVYLLIKLPKNTVCLFRIVVHNSCFFYIALSRQRLFVTMPIQDISSICFRKHVSAASKRFIICFPTLKIHCHVAKQVRYNISVRNRCMITHNKGNCLENHFWRQLGNCF